MRAGRGRPVADTGFLIESLASELTAAAGRETDPERRGPLSYSARLPATPPGRPSRGGGAGGTVGRHRDNHGGRDLPPDDCTF